MHRALCRITLAIVGSTGSCGRPVAFALVGVPRSGSSSAAPRLGPTCNRVSRSDLSSGDKLESLANELRGTEVLVVASLVKSGQALGEVIAGVRNISALPVRILAVLCDRGRSQANRKDRHAGWFEVTLEVEAATRCRLDALFECEQVVLDDDHWAVSLAQDMGCVEEPSAQWRARLGLRGISCSFLGLRNGASRPDQSSTATLGRHSKALGTARPRTAFWLAESVARSAGSQAGQVETRPTLCSAV